MEISRKSDIYALTTELRKQYLEIEELYAASLHEKEIKPELKLKVKSFLENARSALDYAAHDIADINSITAQKIYFPIVGKDKNKLSFESAIGSNLPGLQTLNKAIFDYLESVQPYHEGNEWLSEFTSVAIQNKHSQLTPQTRTETHQITSTHAGGGSVSWNPSGVRFGSGVFINGAPVNPSNQMPQPTSQTTLTKQVWIDFKFDKDVSAIKLLKHVFEEVPKIIANIYSLI